MPVSLRIIVAALLVAIVPQASAFAQWRQGATRGLFGEREFGRPLKPRESRFGSGLERGPSGNFVGRANTDRETMSRSRAPAPREAPSLTPPEAYDLEPDMVPGYLAEQARRLAEVQSQGQPQPAAPMPGQPVPYPPQQPVLPAQPAQPSLAPGIPGPSREELRTSPDRWFRGGTNPSQPGQSGQPGVSAQSARPSGNAMITAPPALGRSYLATPTLGPVATPGPAALRGQAALSGVPLGARITRQLGPRATSPISAVQQGGTVTLQGRVATEGDRAVAEQMARFEPGVRSVVNQISVEAAQPAP